MIIRYANAIVCNSAHGLVEVQLGTKYGDGVTVTNITIYYDSKGVVPLKATINYDNGDEFEVFDIKVVELKPIEKTVKECQL